eukprot:12066214-Alexandrium_andersonii.AAC.1
MLQGRGASRYACRRRVNCSKSLFGLVARCLQLDPLQSARSRVAIADALCDDSGRQPRAQAAPRSVAERARGTR